MSDEALLQEALALVALRGFPVDHVSIEGCAVIEEVLGMLYPSARWSAIACVQASDSARTGDGYEIHGAWAARLASAAIVSSLDAAFPPLNGIVFVVRNP